MTALPVGIAEWTAMRGPAKLLDAVRARARRGYRTETGTLSALRLNPEERREVALLLGTPWGVSDRPPRLQDLASRLAEHDLSVLGLIELIDGRPIETDGAVRQARIAATEAETVQVAAALEARGIGETDVRAWLSDAGLPRPGRGELSAFARDVATVWKALPRHDKRIRLAPLAASTLHDSHALDADRQLGRAVARLAAVVNGLERPRRAGKAWRNAWDSVYVQCDGVSSRVLVLNLRLDGEGHAARWCRASTGEPVWLTLRSLSDGWQVRPSTVYVCENVTVVEAAADALATSCPAMVCTDGTASGAALDLIAGLAEAGCAIRYRADFDPAGFVIAEQILSAAPTAAPWRFDAATYLRALDLGAVEPTDRSLIALRAAFDRHGKAVHEERILDDLIADLSAPSKMPQES